MLACGPGAQLSHRSGAELWGICPFWPDRGLVVETDSLRHHRTAAEQAVDLGRDQTHARAGLRTLRFSHSQVFHRPDHVRAVLADTFRHL